MVQPPKEGAAQHSNQRSPAAPQPARDGGGAEGSPTWAAATVPLGATVPAAAPRFAPILLTLRDGPSALQVFEDLQKRHASALANKRAELRSFVGPDGNTWFRLIAVPAVAEAEAKKLCQALGAEGKALGCTVAPL